MSKASHEDFHDDIEGITYDLSVLDDQERELVHDLLSFATKHPDARTGEYRNYFIARVGGFYEARGLTRSQVTKTTVWRIAQNIAGRLMVAAGIARNSGDYRDKLDALIREKYGNRRRFCELTGISEDMLSHVLAKRKHLSIQSLADALAKIGYTVDIAPMADLSPPTSH